MHKNADLDALSSAYYLSMVLGNCDIAADGLDRFAKEISHAFSIKVLDSVILENYDEIVTVDVASQEQLGKFKDVKINTVYDHHMSNNIDAPKRFVNYTYPSCAEMIYDMYPNRGDEKSMILLIGGITSDTRWFRHANSHTFEIVNELLSQINGDYAEFADLFDFTQSFSEKIAILKGMQRMKYRTKGNKIISATVVSAHESSVAISLIDVADVVFVASQRTYEVRITGRSRMADLLRIFGEVANDFSCTYGGHPNAAGMSCIGDAEALLNALIRTTEDFI